MHERLLNIFSTNRSLFQLIALVDNCWCFDGHDVKQCLSKETISSNTFCTDLKMVVMKKKTALNLLKCFKKSKSLGEVPRGLTAYISRYELKTARFLRKDTPLCRKFILNLGLKCFGFNFLECKLSPTLNNKISLHRFNFPPQIINRFMCI